MTERHPGLEGTWCPALTPVDENLDPDPVRFAEHARWLLAHGCHGIVVFGTTGEASSFSVDERIALVDAAVAAGLPPRQMMIGTGCCALTDSVRLTAHAAGIGAAGVLVLPPFYFKELSDDGLCQSYAELMRRVGDPGLPLVLYHFPQLAGVPIPEAVIERLAQYLPATLAGIKDSSGDPGHTLGLVDRFPGLAVFPGTEALLLPALRRGGAGSITATANINPGAIRRVYDAWAAGDPNVEALQRGADAVRQAMAQAHFVEGHKAVIAHLRGDPGWSRVRPPLTPLAPEALQRLLADLERAGFAWTA